MYIMQFEYKQEYNLYIVVAIGIIFFIVVGAVMLSRKSHAYAASKETATTAKLNQNIYSVNPIGGCKPNGACSLRDYYIMGSYNTCVEGPYNGGSVSISYLKNAIAQGYRFLDFEIYSSETTDPIVSCSVNETQCGTDATTFYSVPFADVMDAIDTYAFTNSGCNNFKDPLIVNLRIKTCDVNVVSKLADIFKKHSRRMLGSAYSFNKQNSNFGDAPLVELMGKVCLFVDSKSVDYSSNAQFMEYVNSSTITGFVKEMTQSAFKNIPSLDDLIEYNKRNMTIILPDYANPQNSVLQAYQNAGCQVVAMMSYKTDSYMGVQDSYFSTQYHSAFVLKPEKYRYIPETIPAPTPQAPANSYASRPLDTGVAGIKFDI
jgi:hypothetical protein